MRGGAPGVFGRWARRLALVVAGLGVPAPVQSSPPQSPVELHLQRHATGLRWELRAHQDVLLVETRVRTFPPASDASVRLPERLGAGETRHGEVALGPACRWLGLRILLRTSRGEQWIGASWGASPSGAPRDLRRLAKSTEPAGVGVVRAHFLFEDRLLGVQGYTGATQLLPLRYIDVALVGDAGQVLAQGSLSAEGELQLPLPAEFMGDMRLQLWSSTRRHPDFDLAVMEREEDTSRFRRHVVETPPFTAGTAGVDLGTYVLEDPDGFGRVQAFHILDLALDAFEMLSAPTWLGRARRDSLRFVWGPEMRTRATATAGDFIQLASPGGGDTDGWSDAVILHEVGHFVAQHYGRDDSAGGLHFLGDVEQDLTLAFSEGWATAFAGIVQSWRARERRNLSGAPAETHAAWYIDAGMPPPRGSAGGLQLGWDQETSSWLDGRDLLRDGIGSESNVASVLWDLVDDETTLDGSPGADDDGGSVGLASWWSAFEALRSLPEDRRATLEDYWLAAQSDFVALEKRFLQRVFLEQGRIEFIRDAAEPDDGPAQARDVAPRFPARVPGGVVIDEIDPGTSPAVEISNRGTTVVTLQGWRLDARRNGASTNPGLSLRFPPDVHLAPGARLVIHGDGRPEDGTVRHLIAPHWTMPWFPQSDGALILVDEQGRTQDFLRWSAADGEASRTPIPEDTAFFGEIGSPGFGKTLQRWARTDTDQAADFHAAPSTLGSPNDVDLLHRTFFPSDDRDDLRFLARRDGAYTLQTLGLRNGAEPQLQLAAAGRPPLIPRQGAPGAAAEVTLWLQEGETVQIALQHQGERTHFGSYDLALYAEPEALTPHAPEGVQVRVDEARGTAAIAWWNGARYDSTSLWLDGAPYSVLHGTAAQAEIRLAPGVHRLQLQAHLGDLDAWAPELLVQAGPLPEILADDFEFLSKDIWEVQGPWGLASAPGRPGRALSESPEGPYASNQRATVRSRQTFAVQEATTLCFDHICIVRPEDKALVQVSDDWGARWTTLGRWDLRDHRGVGESSRWNDGRADPEDWVHECLPLGGFAGRRLQVRFVFESDVFGNAEGWWIDALRLGDVSAPSPRFHLEPAVPNPFNARTRLRFEITQPGPVSLRLFDARGRLVRVLVEESLEAGEHSATWDGRGDTGLPMSSGIYFLQLQSGASRGERKIVLLR